MGLSLKDTRGEDPMGIGLSASSCNNLDRGGLQAQRSSPGTPPAGPMTLRVNGCGWPPRPTVSELARDRVEVGRHNEVQARAGRVVDSRDLVQFGLSFSFFILSFLYIF